VTLSVNSKRLLSRVQALGQLGRDAQGRLSRIACSPADQAGRDQWVVWLRQAGLEVAIDRIGNIFGIWSTSAIAAHPAVLIGSHIDSVVNGGIYDGSYGVLSGLEVIETLKASGYACSRPLAVAAFTNEEGARYAPDMMGSLVYAGGLPVEAALASIGTDGTTLGTELAGIGYVGDKPPGFLALHAYVELHIEQGPVLEREGIAVGVVENLQGISWQRITIEGTANHAGTTPMALRRDAGVAAARVITFLNDQAVQSQTASVATVGCISFAPNVINVIPSRATFTVDLRNPDEALLQADERKLADYLVELAAAEGVKISAERLSRSAPVTFDSRIVKLIEDAAQARGFASKRMTSGAGHDAQMIARMAPAGMIFVPSIGGISHNPKEHTAEADLITGANILLDVIARLAREA
jgi:beta-ureidopropionase / N-carbamoyl-L-amino-acid hydrolase